MQNTVSKTVFINDLHQKGQNYQMTHRRGHHNTWCDQLFCFDLVCSFHGLALTAKNSIQGMNEPYQCPLCGQTECTHTPPDLPDLVDTAPPPPRLYPRLPSAPPAELSNDSSIESAEESLRTTDAERAGTVPASPQATAMAMAGTRAQANPTVERGPPRRRNVRPTNLPLPLATAVPTVATTSTTTSSAPPLRPGETIWHSVTDGRRRRRAHFFRPRNPQGQQSGKTNLFIVRKR